MDVDEDTLIGKPTDEVPTMQPTDEDCMGQRTNSDGTFAGYCRSTPGRGTDHVGEGRCKHHGGKNSGENGQGATEGNDNAVTHGAFREFFAETLTDAEAQAVEQAEALLEDTTDAQKVGRTAASLCLVQYRRTGDERFMRRFESICDTFEIAPEDVERVQHEGEVEHTGGFEVSITRHRVTEEDVNDE